MTTEKGEPMTMSGFCEFAGSNGHTYCQRKDCTCACHVANPRPIDREEAEDA